MWGKILSGAKKAYSTFQTGKAVKDNLSSNQAEEKVVNFKMLFIIPVATLALLFISPFVDKNLGYNSMYGSDSTQAHASENSGNNSDAPADWENTFYYQWDGPWANVAYDANGNTIGTAGCGLVSITHCIDLLANKSFTPDEISNQLRDYYNGNVAAYAPGGSIVGKLVEFAENKYNLQSTHYTNVGDALADMSSGNKVMILSDSDSGPHFIVGETGAMYSANHVIMCYKSDGENCWIKDSGQGGNSVKYTKSQLAYINFVGYYVLSNK